MRILLTNDDGIDAPGIKALHAALTNTSTHAKRRFDHPIPGPDASIETEVFTVAPLTVQSATSHGVTFHQPLMTRPSSDCHPGVAVDGRPADCVKLGLTELWQQRFGEGTRPDLVVSGMNAGANVGINIIYSGTVAAAIEAAFLGVPSIAVSLHLGRGRPDFDTAACHARAAIEQILTQDSGKPDPQTLDPHEVININVPRCEHPEQAADQSVEEEAAERAKMGLPAQPVDHRTKPTDAGEHDAGQAFSGRPLGDASDEYDPETPDPALHGPDAADPHDPDAMPPIAVCPMNCHGIADRFERRQTPAGQSYYWSASRGFDFHETDPGSDVEMLFKRCITVTPLRYDLTDHDQLQRWKGLAASSQAD